jgi:hypothetical protein
VIKIIARDKNKEPLCQKPFKKRVKQALIIKQDIQDLGVGLNL